MIQESFPSLISKIVTPSFVPAANLVPSPFTLKLVTHPPNESVVACNGLYNYIVILSWMLN